MPACVHTYTYQKNKFPQAVRKKIVLRYLKGKEVISLQKLLKLQWIFKIYDLCFGESKKILPKQSLGE